MYTLRAEILCVVAMLKMEGGVLGEGTGHRSLFALRLA